MSSVAQVGSLISFEYPSANYLFARQRWERRLVHVDEIHEGPPPQHAIDADPLLNRAGPLIVGRDYCRHSAVRSFYLGAARGIIKIGANAPLDSLRESLTKELATSQGFTISGSVEAERRSVGAKGQSGMDGYQVWIVEECDENTATLAPAGFESGDIEEANAWAGGFNRAEMSDDPVNAWAIVRRAPSVHQNL